MSEEPQTFEKLTRDLFATDPKNALDVAIAATEVARIETEKARLEAREMSEVKIGPGGFEASTLGGLYRVGKLYSRSMLVPEAFRGKAEDCAIVAQLAARWKVDPFMAFQHVYIVHGKPGVDSQMAISLLHASGKIEGTIQYDSKGTGLEQQSCRAYVKDASTGEIVYGPLVNYAMVKAEGWAKAKGKSGTPSKWSTLPDLMYLYRAAMYLIRTRYPEVIMGMQATEELTDIGPSLEDAGLEVPVSSLDDLAEKLSTRKPTSTTDLIDEAEALSTGDPPEVATREAIAEAEGLLADATLLGQCDEILDGLASSGLPEVTKEHIAKLCRNKKSGLRKRRGPRSNAKKEEEPEAESPGLSPEEMASLAKCEHLMDRLETSTQQQTIVIENEAMAAQSTGDLTPADCEAVTGQCRVRFRELAAEAK